MNKSLTPTGRVALAAGALATLAVLTALQCLSLEVGPEIRAGLSLIAAVTALMCMALLIEDLVGDRMRAVFIAILVRLRTMRVPVRAAT